MEVVELGQVAEYQEAVVGNEAAPRWLIDAWLPVEGRVFISQRVGRDDVWAEADDDDGAQASPVALLLRAPEFEPEYVDRGLAFGAVQRGAQEGFSIDGENEFGFDSVAQVSAFVRRIYCGSGPDPNRGGQPVPINPEQGGPRGHWPRFDPDHLAPAQTWKMPRYESIDVTEIEQRLIAADLSLEAGSLLIGSLYEAFEQTDGLLTLDGIWPQLHAAMLLTRDRHEFWRDKFVPALQSHLLPTEDPGLAKIVRAIEEIVAFGPMYWPRLREVRIEDLSGWLLPRDRLNDLELPLHVHSWLEALCYLRSDRSYLSDHPVGKWGALLLALLAPLESGRAADSNFWRHSHGFPSIVIERSLRMAAELIPVASLPPALEDNIEQWSRRAGPALPTAPPSQPPSSQPPPTPPTSRLPSAI